MIKLFVFSIILGILISHVSQKVVRIYLYRMIHNIIEIDYLLIDLINIIISYIILIQYKISIISCLYLLMLFFFNIIYSVDKQTMIIPDIPNFSILLLGIIKMIFCGFRLTNVIVVGLIFVIFVLVDILFYKKNGYGMIGFGDLKLITFYGLLTSVTQLIFGITIACLLAIVTEIIVKKKRHNIFPFGPYLVMGFLFTLLFLKFVI